ncbi:MAG: EAL domain-containing protein [Methylophilaceae bacterium]|nr:EAL domain-containing protein [Methylophilaceae bacterium]
MSPGDWLESLVKLAVDGQSDLIFVKDRQHRYLLANAEFASMLGLNPEELVGKPDIEIWPKDMCVGNPESGWRGFHQDEDTACAGEDVFHPRDCIRLPDGTEHLFDTFYTPILDGHGEVHAVLGRWRKVTSPRETIQALREGEHRLRTLIDASPDSIVFKDGKGRWLVANRAALLLFQLAGKPWHGRTDAELTEMLPPALGEALLRWAQSDEAAWQAQGPTHTKEFINQPDGSHRLFDVHRIPTFDQDSRRKSLIVLAREMTEIIDAMARLQEERAFFESMLQGVSLPAFILGTDHCVKVWNRALEEMTGIRAAEVLGTKDAWRGFYGAPRPTLADLMIERRHDIVEAYYHTYSKAEYSEGAFRAEGWFELKGRRRYLSFEATPIRNAAGAMVGAIETLYDITDHIQALEQLRLAGEVFANSHEAIVITDAQNNIVSVNRAFTEITGYTQEEVVGRNPRLLSSGRHDKAFYQALWHSLKTHGHWQGEIWDRRKNGEVYPKWSSISTVRNLQGELTHYVAIFSDLSERHASKSMVEFLTYYDPLTRLPNRALLRDRCVQVLAAAGREGLLAALLLIDLDAFKHVNDSLGHVVGDRLLQQVATRIRECVRETDTLGRLGGDEFIVLLADVTDAAAAERVAQKILAAFEEPVAVDGHRLDVALSIGACLYPDDGDDFDTLLKKADAAMYAAKKGEGGNVCRFYAGHMSDNMLEHLQLRGQLAQAIREEFAEFTLHYQPQLDLATGATVGMEALLRWNSPHLGPVSPANFIPVAEASGVISQLGAWVIREACRQNRVWQDAGLEPVVVAVNLSAVQFRRGNIVQTVAEALEETGLAPQWLELELTESILVHNVEHVLEVLRQLKQIGVRLSIDDFGTGYSSLAYLKRFKVDKLKIDQSFVRNMTVDEDDAAIVHSVIQLGQSLKLRTIAEGVETAAHAEHLRREGCDEVQGYLYSRPLPAEEVTVFLQRRATFMPTSTNVTIHS